MLHATIHGCMLKNVLSEKCWSNDSNENEITKPAMK